MGHAYARALSLISVRDPDLLGVGDMMAGGVIPLGSSGGAATEYALNMVRIPPRLRLVAELPRWAGIVGVTQMVLP
jgi:hypothetical protein